MSISNGEHVLMIQLDWKVIGDDASIELGVVGLGQSNYVNLRKAFHGINEINKIIHKR